MHELMRILIADDSEILRIRLIDILSEIEGVEVVGQAETVDEVLKAVENLKPDVLILDIQMSDDNGITALEIIKKRENPPIVIMFTNYPYLQYRKKCLDLGADFFFYKAVEFSKLINLINKLVESSQAKKE